MAYVFLSLSYWLFYKKTIFPSLVHLLEHCFYSVQLCVVRSIRSETESEGDTGWQHLPSSRGTRGRDGDGTEEEED